MRNQYWQKDIRFVSYPRPLVAAKNQRSLVDTIILIWLLGTVVFLPIKILNLPMNFELVDIWILMGLPAVTLVFLVRRRQIIGLSYLLPMWLVLLSSFLSSFTAHSPSNSLFIMLKEAYLFAWFIIATILLKNLKADGLRVVLIAWSIVVVFHGLLMIAQFLSPEVWRLTNSLGGNSARIEGYRAAGLFICDKAGCANKAAYFQLLGFVPILLAGFSRRTTILLGTITFVSILSTGSMGATLAFTAGVIIFGITIAFYKKKLLLVLKYILRAFLAALLLGALFYIISSQNESYRDHFRKIIIGRFEKSSGGRFDLWQRGFNVLLEQNAFFWGVGPDNFRVVDVTGADNQLHNDTLAFLVERGLIGVVGLGLFAGIAIGRAISILHITGRDPKTIRLELIIFLAVLAATVIESLTHQIFRTRELWLVLAIQETIYFYLRNPEVHQNSSVPSVSRHYLFNKKSALPSKISNNG